MRSPNWRYTASGSNWTFCTTYCAQDSMSRAGTRVSRPAHRPTIASTPSVPITSRARSVSSFPPGPRPSPRARRPRPARRSRASGRHHRERAHGAGRDALAAAGTGVAIDDQLVERQVDRLGRAEGQTETTAVADLQIDARDDGGAGMRHAANLSEPGEERQASALLGVSVFSS